MKQAKVNGIGWEQSFSSFSISSPTVHNPVIEKKYSWNGNIIV